MLERYGLTAKEDFQRMKCNSKEWSDRRRMMYVILTFSITINVYGALRHPEASETSLISHICLGSLETISLRFSGYSLGRVAEKHSSLRGDNGNTTATEDPLGSSNVKETPGVSKSE